LTLDPYNGVLAWGDYVKPDGKIVRRLEEVQPDGHRVILEIEVRREKNFPAIAARALVSINKVIENALAGENRK